MNMNLTAGKTFKNYWFSKNQQLSISFQRKKKLSEVLQYKREKLSKSFLSGLLIIKVFFLLYFVTRDQIFFLHLVTLVVQ